MSHRIKRFAAFAIFALFYHFVAVDSILGSWTPVDTKVDTKTGQPQRQNQVYQMRGIWCPLPGHQGETFPGSNAWPGPLRLENQLQLLTLIHSASKNLSGLRQEAIQIWHLRF